MTTTSFDEIDRKILDLLQQRDRPVGEIAEKVGLSQTPCWRRIRRMEEAGVIRERVTLVEPHRVRDGELFEVPAVGLREEREENRRTMAERCEAAAARLEDAEHGVAWCHLNDESTMLTSLIDGGVEVSGGDSPDAKEEKLRAFSAGEIRVLVTKPSIGAWGLNWQHAHRMTYFPSHSYEQMYQAVRRLWRFGQQNPVTVDIITTPGGERVLDNLHRKADQADRMFDSLVAHMSNALNIPTRHYDQEMQVPSWLS